MWHLMLTVDLLKHGIPDPSLITLPYPQSSTQGQDKENNDNFLESHNEFLATPVFVHTKLQDQLLCHRTTARFRKALEQYFSSSSFNGINCANATEKQVKSSGSADTLTGDRGWTGHSLFLLPARGEDDSQRVQYQSYTYALGQLRNQILSMNSHPFAKTVSERDWLRNSARIWEIVKKSPIIADYSTTLQSSGLFRK